MSVETRSGGPTRILCGREKDAAKERRHICRCGNANSGSDSHHSVEETVCMVAARCDPTGERNLIRACIRIWRRARRPGRAQFLKFYEPSATQHRPSPSRRSTFLNSPSVCRVDLILMRFSESTADNGIAHERRNRWNERTFTLSSHWVVVYRFLLYQRLNCFI